MKIFKCDYCGIELQSCIKVSINTKGHSNIIGKFKSKIDACEECYNNLCKDILEKREKK